MSITLVSRYFRVVNDFAMVYNVGMIVAQEESAHSHHFIYEVQA
jgi:hypothetical protein